ncbi:uncharacterized protein LOC105698993 [Orussus abietinus]|uniref:uncharacterized protein LOC105698993 n=1 Tax=Orussus abietinus TaxID=222816 RepID=UPI0006254745|nr:uncharacterized protein LOC105698993 [Orussus abietinus]
MHYSLTNRYVDRLNSNIKIDIAHVQKSKFQEDLSILDCTLVFVVFFNVLALRTARVVVIEVKRDSSRSWWSRNMSFRGKDDDEALDLVQHEEVAAIPLKRPLEGEKKVEKFLKSKFEARREVWIMEAFRGLYFLLRTSKIKSDSFVSRLHVLTAFLLLGFSVTVSTRQTVGNPIDCVHTREIPLEVFNAYCWIHSTYFVTAAMLGIAGVNVAFPGVAPSLVHHYQRHNVYLQKFRVGEDSTKQVKYYQWVAFALLLQSKETQSRPMSLFETQPRLYYNFEK